MGVDQSLILFKIPKTYDVSHDKLQNSLSSMARQGFKISIDDFGTKFSTIKQI